MLNNTCILTNINNNYLNFANLLNSDNSIIISNSNNSLLK